MTASPNNADHTPEGRAPGHRGPAEQSPEEEEDDHKAVRRHSCTGQEEGSPGAVHDRGHRSGAPAGSHPLGVHGGEGSGRAWHGPRSNRAEEQGTGRGNQACSPRCGGDCMREADPGDRSHSCGPARDEVTWIARGLHGECQPESVFVSNQRKLGQRQGYIRWQCK